MTYLTVTFEYAADEDVIDGFPGVNATSHICEPVSTTPPVVLSGLVKGGEYATVDDWEDCDDDEALCVDAVGRVCRDHDIRLGEASFPLTWYRYEEA